MKNTTMIWIGVAILALLILIVTPISMYNGLVKSEENVNAKWADVESSYQRRLDLIPNLVSTVQGAADFESDTLSEITAIRSDAVSAQSGFASADSIQGQAQAAAQGEAALGRLLVIMENYPQLTATQNFQDLQVQLEGTENRINVARNRYNEAAQEYNAKIRLFPRSIIAGMAGFERKDFFEANDGAEVAPTVDFS